MKPELTAGPGDRSQFVVVTSQRTGSTLLVRSLDSADGIFCAGELFHMGTRTLHPEFQYPYLHSGDGIASHLIEAFRGRVRVRQHLERFYSEAGQGARAVGFKLMISQAATYRAILPWLRDHKVAAVFLYRRNAFDTALSYYKARVSGRFHSDRRETTGRGDTVTADVDEFRRLFAACIADRRRLFELREWLGGMVLAYEDLVDHWEESFAAIGMTLGVPDLRAGKALNRLADREGLVVTNEESLRGRFIDRQARDDRSRALSPNADSPLANPPVRR